ncbi:hypothetical protein FRC11_014344 [Ceratobasidium sp. 423]|nr:hypothetical protein FRC11_014344 [Ceratobasidium sp. 423]
MNTQQSMELRRRKWFRSLHEDVDPDNDEDELTKQRLEQWRPFWQNPFAHPDLGLTSGNDHPRAPVVDVGGDDEKALEKLEMNRASTDLSQLDSVSKPVEVRHAGPAWVHLFYDLAWTATFSTLTQNGTFNGPWDNLSYVTFFLVMWWLWASQTLYSVHFYTNDWFHLGSIFAQLIIFGLLAATTRGYDVTMYISKSPGADRLDQQTMDQMTDPERYREDRVVSHSLDVIAFSLAFSRMVHWFQHILVWRHACHTARTSKLHIPLKVCILPLGLFVSFGFFWAAAGVTISDLGKTRHGAIIKFVLWGVGLLVEIVLHGIMESLGWERTFRRAKESAKSHGVPPQTVLPKEPPQSPKSSPAPRDQAWPEPYSSVNLRGRLEGITTVILGEGLNGIAGTLYAIISAPGSYLSTTDKTFRELDEVMLSQNLYLDDPTATENLPMKNFLLKRGLEWAKEINSLNATVTHNYSIPLENVSEQEFNATSGAWGMQMTLKVMVELYKTFMGGNQTIDSDMQNQIQEYYTNYTLAHEDYANEYNLAASYHYIAIVSKLLDGNVLGARYVTGLAGIILISLGLMNAVHSKPRDRFQWGIILTRIVMGSALLLLEVLNVGHYQTLWVIEDQLNQRAGVIRWIWAWWVLPTLAVAFGAEFFFELILLRCAGLAIERKRGRVSGPLWRIFFKGLLGWFGWVE